MKDLMKERMEFSRKYQAYQAMKKLIEYMELDGWRYKDSDELMETVKEYLK